MIRKQALTVPTYLLRGNSAYFDFIKMADKCIIPVVVNFANRVYSVLNSVPAALA